MIFRLALERARVTSRRIQTDSGPREILEDRSTGISLSIPIGRTLGGVVEDVFDRERFCDERTIRIVDIPSRQVPGKIVRQMFCCIKGKTLRKPVGERTCKPGFFVQTFFIHPRKLAARLRREFMRGELQARRRKILETIQRARL